MENSLFSFSKKLRSIMFAQTATKTKTELRKKKDLIRKRERKKIALSWTQICFYCCLCRLPKKFFWRQNLIKFFSEVVLVVQSCKRSRCTPTILDVKAHCSVAGDYIGGFCDHCQAPHHQSAGEWLPKGAK